jgi:protein TonB
MKWSFVICYAVAVAFHAVVLFYLKPPASHPPKMIERTYVDIALTAPPPPESPKPQPPPSVPQPKIETPTPQPKPEPKPQPTTPKADLAIPAPKPEPPPPVAKLVIIPQSKPPMEYVPVTQPNYARRAEPIYPEQARRWHQEGIVVLALFINELGALDKVEILKSSGFPLLDAAAVKAMKQSRFDPAMDGVMPIRARAEATVTFRLE